MSTGEAFKRKDTSRIPRRLKHAGVERRRAAVGQAETRVRFAAADLAEWDRKLAEVIDRSRGEAPLRESMDDLRANRERALFTKSAREAELDAARKALVKALETAPTDAQVAAWQAELEKGLKERRRAAELLADPGFGNRIREIRHALGDADGLGALGSEVAHIGNLAATILTSFTERNTIAKRWWMPGAEDGN